jgi:hypothetical protein
MGIGFLAFGVLALGCDTSPAAKKVEEKSKAGVSAVKSAAKEGVQEVKEAAKEGAKEVKDVATEGAKEVKEVAGAAADKAKELVVKPIQEMLPKIEDKISGLSGDAKVKAKEKLEDLKKLLEEVKAGTPEKWEALKTKITDAFNELKKLVGLDK